MINAKELSVQKVGENEFVIRREYRDEQERRCTQFLAHVANATTDNEAVAKEFIGGISVLNAMKSEYEHMIQIYGSYETALAYCEANEGVSEELMRAYHEAVK